MSDAPEQDTAWQRLHPLTPVLRSGRYLLVVLIILGQQGRQQSRLLALLLLLLGTLAAAGIGWLSWRATSYRVEGAELHVRSGVFQKQDRRVPLARLQTVDLVRPLLARVTGLVELRLEVVGQGDSEAKLSFLSEPVGTALRTELLARSTQAPTDETAAPPPAELLLVEVQTDVLITSVLLGAPAITGIVVLVGLVVTTAIDLRAGAAAAATAVPLLVGTLGLAARRVIAEYGFSVAEVPQGLRLRQGLLDRRTQTIPPGKVQTLRVTEPILWRRRGWVRVEVDVAGYSATGGTEQTLTSALLPVAPRAVAEQLLERVLGAQLPRATQAAPPAARRRAPLSSPKLRVGLDERFVVAQRGILTTTTDVVPLAKVQSVRRTQGPWQRWLGLGSVHVDSAGRRLTGAELQHRPYAETEGLARELADRSRTARQGSSARP